MRLPNGNRAIITGEKLLGFVLNPDHPHGFGHAHLFDVLLGINRVNVGELRQHLLLAAEQGDATPGKPSDFGTKYEIRSEMTGPRGTHIILSVWMIRTGENDPRLVTAYVE